MLAGGLSHRTLKRVPWTSRGVDLMQERRTRDELGQTIAGHLQAAETLLGSASTILTPAEYLPAAAVHAQLGIAYSLMEAWHVDPSGH